MKPNHSLLVQTRRFLFSMAVATFVLSAYILSIDAEMFGLVGIFDAFLASCLGLFLVMEYRWPKLRYTKHLVVVAPAAIFAGVLLTGLGSPEGFEMGLLLLECLGLSFLSGYLCLIICKREV